MKKIFFLSVLAVLTISMVGCKSKEEPQTPSLITIDGQIKDWDAAIADKQVVQAYLSETKKYDKKNLKKLAIYVNATDIYFMVAFDPTQTQPLDMFFATQGEVPTDAINLWNPCYVDYCIEFGKGDTFVDDPTDMDWSNWNYQQLMAYDHQKGGWNWTNLGQNMVTISNKVNIGSDVYVEGKLPRSTFSFSQNYFYVGAFISDNNWAVIGAQPATTIVDEQLVSPAMLKVTLP